MNKTTRAGMSGKGFYAALSLSVAMVGAACWYAYSGTEKPEQQNQAESSMHAEISVPNVTSLPAGLHEAAPAVTQTQRTTANAVTTAPDAENAAALVHKTTAETTAKTTVTAETEAKIELPMMPAAGEVTAHFSFGELVKSPTTGIWQTHNGIDIAAAPGSDVCAVLDGTVIAVERDALWGICVTMLHDDGAITRYCGLNEGLNAEAGQVLVRGTVLGAVGDTNEAESGQAPHLHFEVLKNDIYVDPEGYLAGKPVRAPETIEQNTESE